MCCDCIDLCPQSGADATDPVLVLAPDNDEILVSNIESCIACYSCCEFCRAAAIVIAGSQNLAGDQPVIFASRPADRII